MKFKQRALKGRGYQIKTELPSRWTAELLLLSNTNLRRALKKYTQALEDCGSAAQRLSSSEKQKNSGLSYRQISRSGKT